jgi:hypothetical protein
MWTEKSCQCQTRTTINAKKTGVNFSPRFVTIATLQMDVVGRTWLAVHRFILNGEGKRKIESSCFSVMTRNNTIPDNVAERARLDLKTTV